MYMYVSSAAVQLYNDNCFYVSIYQLDYELMISMV